MGCLKRRGAAAEAWERLRAQLFDAGARDNTTIIVSCNHPVVAITS